MIPNIWNVVLSFAVLHATQSLDQKGCKSKPADVVFLLDSSGSIKYHDFQKQLDFAKNLANMFDIGPQKTLVGMLSYSTTVEPEFSLGEYKDRDDIIRKISDVKYQGGGTNTGEALSYLRHKAFGSNSRRQVSHVAIILTDGKSTNLNQTLDEAAKVHRDGIVVFVIGIGDEVREEELKAIASHPSKDHMYMIDKYDALDAIKEELAEKTCEVPPATMPTNMVSDMDILYGNAECKPEVSMQVEFSFDAAGIGNDNVRFVLMFIASVSDRLNARSKPLRIKTVTSQCSTKDYAELKFGTGNDRQNIENMLSPGKITPVASIIRKTRISFIRNQMKKVGVLVISGTLLENDFRKARREIKRAAFLGMMLYVIGVGERIQREQLNSLTTGMNQVFYTKFYETLEELEGPLLLSLCRLKD